ncbi:MAG: tetratricopeptide repeat protein [Proteobacteria bacterium]|nr:tetratricopeptide repeat protein [Pseudomonadota bacterium]
MSLLMDALKKAEQEKKAAAKRLREAQEQSKEQSQDHSSDDDRTLTQELSMEDDSVDSAQTASDSAPDVTAEIEGLSLSPVTDPQLVSEEIEDKDKLSTTGEIELKTSESTESEHPPKLDKTFALTDLQVEEVVAEQADDQAEDTLQDELPYDSETLSDASDEYFSATVSAAQLAEDIGGDSPTPVAAQTVFAASSSRPGNQVLQWGIFLVLCLVIAVSLSLFVFNYTIPVDRSIKSPLVAKDIEIQSEPALTFEIPEGLISSADVDSSLFTGEITDVIEKANDTTIKEGQTGSEAEGFPESERSHEMIAKAADTRSALAQEGIEQEKVWTPSEDDSTGDAAAVVVEVTVATLPEKIMLEPRLIKISRSKSIDKHGVLINEAFQEYLVGDYDSAEVSYRNVLKELPDNRDALLGLAAISSRKGQLRQAYDNYLEVLRLYPGDSVAEAALINYQRDGDYARNESILKTFIQREPDNSFLYYSLGRLYAAQIRWPEAQQSFFNAYNIETSNPDYAFNLAVSLDHIGQQQSAIDYYNAALELANQSSGGAASISFDRAVIISRINALSSLADLQ